MEEDASGPDFAGFTDGSGYANNGFCASECPVVNDQGLVAQGLDFNGTTSGIDAGPNSVFDWGASASFSIEVWFKRTPGISNKEVLVGRNDRSSRLQWWIGLTDNGMAAFYLESTTGEGSTQMIESADALDDGIWHHIVAVRDYEGGKNLLYVDGKLHTAAASYLSGFASTEPITIGYMNDGALPDFHFNGTIDEVAIYNTIPLEETIMAHYYLSKGYCSLYDDPVRIMPLGDSITYDDYTGAPSGTGWRVAYRQPLYFSLESSLYWVDFVGSRSAGETATPAFDTHNEAYPGITDEAVSNNVVDWLAANPADIILLHIGSNEPDTDPSHVENLLVNIDSDPQNLNTTVVLARIIERVSEQPEGNNSTTHKFNNAVESMVISRVASGDKIVMVDMEDGAGLDYTVGVDMLDDIHPNENGYEKMAAAWFDTLDDFLPQSSMPQILSMPSLTGNRGELYTYQIEVGGQPTPSVTVVNPDPFPSNFQFDAGENLITWTPGELADEISVLIQASNWAGTKMQPFTITTNDGPQTFDIPNQTIDEGASFDPIVLDNYVDDPDHDTSEITWTCSGNNELIIDFTNRVATISIENEDWNGVETVTFRATDPGGLFAEETVAFQVNGINDKPEILEYHELETSINKEVAITLNNLNVNDPDNLYPDDFTLKVYAGTNYQAYKEDSGYVVVPQSDYTGDLYVPVSVEDGELESNIVNMLVKVIDGQPSKKSGSNSGCFIQSIGDFAD